MLKGRIKGRSGNVFKLHKRGGIYFGAFIIGSFIYGSWIRLQQGKHIMSPIHGKLGLIILLIVIFQLIPSLVLKNRAWYRSLHKIIGYALASILIIDAGRGLHNGVIDGTKNLVLLHSISGGLSALVLVWIIMETLYPTDKSLSRARIASKLSGCIPDNCRVLDCRRLHLFGGLQLPGKTHNPGRTTSLGAQGCDYRLKNIEIYT